MWEECGEESGTRVEAFSTGTLRQKATLLQSVTISVWKAWDKKPLGLAGAFALVSVRRPLLARHRGPSRFFPGLPVCDPLFSFWVAAR